MTRTKSPFSRSSPGRAVFLAIAFLAVGASSGSRPLAAAPSFASTPRPLGGDFAIDRFPDSASLRMRYWDGFFAAPRSIALSRAPSTLSTGNGSFRLLSLRSAKSYYLVIAALRADASRAEPPLYTQGTWILKRASADGSPLQAKVFLRSDPGTFIRIYPAGDRSRMDLVLYGAVLNREVPLPVPFSTAFQSPLSAIVSWTRDTVDWELLSPRPSLYADLRAMNAKIRSRLPALRYADDGALDAEGLPVLIRTGEAQAGPTGLNCSGFAKWVVDGFYRPLAGKLLDPLLMARRHVDLRDSALVRVFEESLDPYFGLDWTRNLGLALAEAREPDGRHDLREADARLSPFALVASPESLAIDGGPSYDAYPVYDENRGYATPGLKAILYILAMKMPGSFYLASISRNGGGEIFGLRRHYHVAVLVPYFEESGEFSVAVFESDAETGLEALMNRVRGDFVHLVGVQATGEFDPPLLP